MAASTATVRARKQNKQSAVRYLVIDGRPAEGWGDNRPKSATDLPREVALEHTQVLGSFATVEGALAESRRVNDALLRTNVFEESWTMVVVDPDGAYEV